MKESWQNISNKFAALGQRERVMVTGALFAVAFFVINTFLLGPVLARQTTLKNEFDADNAQIDNLNQELNHLLKTPAPDVDAESKQHIAALHAQLSTLDAQLDGIKTTLISPNEMPELLRSLLKENGNLKLIALKTLPTTGLLENTANAANPSKEPSPADAPQHKASNTQNAPVYKHGVELTVSGPYLDLLDYVTDLEKMPWHVLWRKAALNAENTPDCQLTLTVYTLSLDQTWLSI